MQQNCRQYRPITEASHEAWFERVSAGDSDQLMFVVETEGRPTPLTDGKITVEYDCDSCVIPVGVVGLCYWDRLHRSAELSFYIGNDRFRKRGLCSDALRTLMAYGFEDLGLHRVWAEVFEFNDESRDLLIHLGMKKDGFLRDSLFRFGEWHGSDILSILEDEWRATGSSSKGSLLNGMESEYKLAAQPETS